MGFTSPRGVVAPRLRAAVPGCGPVPPGEAGDLDLLHRVAAGDDDALGLLFRRWRHRVHQCAVAKLWNDVDLADDAVTETFLAIRRHAREGRLPDDEDAVGRWILGRARFAALRQIDRTRGRRVGLTDQISHRGPGPVEDAGTEAVLERCRTALRRELRKLPPRVREAVVLHFEGRSYREIASVQGGEPSGACSRVRAGILRLVAATHARKRTSRAAGKTLSLSVEERAHIQDLAAGIQARNPGIGLEPLIMEVCRRTGILIGPQSRLVKLLGRSPRRS